MGERHRRDGSNNRIWEGNVSANIAHSKLRLSGPEHRSLLFQPDHRDLLIPFWKLGSSPSPGAWHVQGEED